MRRRWPRSSRSAAVPLGRLIARCLRESPFVRTQSALDLADELAELASDLQAGPAPPVPPRRRRWLVAAAATVAAAALVAGGLVGHRLVPPEPRFQRLTFQRGLVEAARFGPDGQTVYYSARWNGQPPEVFTVRPGVTEPLALGLQGRDPPGGRRHRAAVAPAPGLPPRSRLHVRHAGAGAHHRCAGAAATRGRAPCRSWGRWKPGPTTKSSEFPTGTAAGNEAGFLAIRVAPDGQRIAIMDANAGVAGGRWRRAARPGRAAVPADRHRLEPERQSWLSQVEEEGGSSLVAYDLRGRQRLLDRAPAMLALLDVSRDGQALVRAYTRRREVVGADRGGSSQRVLTWLDDSGPVI